jgi:hypothetical protein
MTKGQKWPKVDIIEVEGCKNPADMELAKNKFGLNFYSQKLILHIFANFQFLEQNV